MRSEKWGDKSIGKQGEILITAIIWVSLTDAVYFVIPFPAAYSKRNNKAGGGRTPPGQTRPDTIRARGDQCRVGHRQPCCERHRVLLVTPGTQVWPGDLVTANVQTKLVMDGGGELVRTIQFTTKHTDHDMLSHCIHRVCTLVKIFVS